MRVLLLVVIVGLSLRLGFVAGNIAGRRRLARELRPLASNLKLLITRLEAQ